MTQITTIFFGSIGTLVKTSELQRLAFYAAFDEAGIGWHWDVETYNSPLKQSGGPKRIEDLADERGGAVNAQGLIPERPRSLINGRLKTG